MKFTTKLRLIVLIISVLSSQFTTIQAKTYYVDKDAVGLNNGTSWDNAWKTTEDINWLILASGDTVFFDGGPNGKIYPEWVKKDNWGSRDGYITFIPSSEIGRNGAVTFYNSSTPDVYGSIYWLNGQKIKVILKGFRVFNPNQNGENISTIGIGNLSDIILDSITVEVGSNSKVSHGICFSSSSNFIIKNSSIVINSNDLFYEQDGIIVGQAKGNALIEGNTIITGGTNSIPHIDGIQFWTNGEMMDTVTIRDNFITHNIGWNGHSASGIYTLGVNGVWNVYNNVVALRGNFGWSSGILLSSGNYFSGLLDVKIYNNTITSTQAQNYLIQIKGADSLQIKNNILFSAAYSKIQNLLNIDSSIFNKTDIDCNQYYKTQGNDISDIRVNGESMTFTSFKSNDYEPNGEWNPASFIGPIASNTATNFSLQARSHGVNSGIPLSLFNQDKLGMIRPVGDKWDRGAFEITTILNYPDSILAETTANPSNPNMLQIEFRLNQNYPNPFNPTTNINFTLPKMATVELKVINILGQEMALLVSEEKTAGTYEVNFDASNLPSGVYIYKLQAGELVATKKMILLK